MIIQVKNHLAVNATKTFLSNNEVAGTTVFRIKNTLGLGSSWAVQMGETGEERSEVLILSGNTGGTAGTLGTTTAASKFSHSADSPIYAIKYDQLVFERSTAGTSGTATPMTNGTLTIQADSPFTQFDDTSGVSTYAYRTYFRNSVLAVNSTESDWITPAGFTFYSLAKIRDRVRKKLWSSNYLQDDTVIDDWVNEWKDQMSNAVISINQDFALGTADVAFGTNGLGTITTNDFKQPRRFWITYNGQDYVESTKQSVNEYIPDQVFSSEKPYHNWQGDSVFEVNPHDSAGTARIQFYRFGTTMANDTDELPLPMRPYTKSFIDYVIAQAYLMDGKINEYNLKLNEAMFEKNQFINQMSPRDLTSQTVIRMVAPISGEDYLI